MALAMARPWKHPKTQVYYLRMRVPSDLVAIVGRKIEKRSLRTKDPAEARTLHLEQATTLSERWSNLRRGHLRPTPREAAAIAGTFYQSITERHREGRYSIFGEPFLHAAALQFRDDPNDDGARTAFRRAFGREIEEGLARLGVQVHPDFVGLVDLAIARAVVDAQEKGMKVVFEGDYSPDPAAAKYPPVSGVLSKSSAVHPSKTLPLNEQFSAYAATVKLAPTTRKRWGLALGHLPGLIGHDDVARFTEDDVSTWITELRNSGRSERTIRDVHLAALKALCNWLIGTRRLSFNCAAGFRIRVPKSVKMRSADLSDEEVQLILSASLAPQPKRLPAKHAAARRWVPWLAAYSGARVNELTQLRREDIKVISGIDVFIITPEAGTVKTSEPRTVPLHPHLVEQGFLEFVRSSKAGPLFYEAREEHSAATPPSKKLGERLARWVRKSGVDDPRVDPFHGWRHRFKTIGRSVKMDADARDALQGHVPKTEGAKYGEFPVKLLHEAMLLVPRYNVSTERTPKAHVR